MKATTKVEFMITCSSCEKDFTEKHVIQWGKNRQGDLLYHCGNCLIWHYKEDLDKIKLLLRKVGATGRTVKCSEIGDVAISKKLHLDVWYASEKAH